MDAQLLLDLAAAEDVAVSQYTKTSTAAMKRYYQSRAAAYRAAAKRATPVQGQGGLTAAGQPLTAGGIPLTSN